jgi:hypothetical protein
MTQNINIITFIVKILEELGQNPQEEAWYRIAVK